MSLVSFINYVENGFKHDKQYKYRSKIMFHKSDYQITRQNYLGFYFMIILKSLFFKIVNFNYCTIREKNAVIFCKNLMESQSINDLNYIYWLLLLFTRFLSPVELHKNKLNLK